MSRFKDGPIKPRLGGTSGGTKPPRHPVLGFTLRIIKHDGGVPPYSSGYEWEHPRVERLYGIDEGTQSDSLKDAGESNRSISEECDNRVVHETQPGQKEGPTRKL